MSTALRRRMPGRKSRLITHLRPDGTPIPGDVNRDTGNGNHSRSRAKRTPLPPERLEPVFFRLSIYRPIDFLCLAFVSRFRMDISFGSFFFAFSCLLFLHLVVDLLNSA
jgi:hypothetical protein